jgi:glucokinase
VILAADIGGTNARLALFDAPGARDTTATTRHRRTPRVVATYRTDAWESVPALLLEFLRTHAAQPTRACVAVAGPVRNGRADAVNLPWPVDAAQIARALELPSVALVNDLAANARGVAALSPDKLRAINAGDPGAAGNRAVISAGTGLGEAGLVWSCDRFHVVAGEGGHSDFAPRNETEIELLRYLMTDYGHVSYERICSGLGLVNIYRFLRDRGTRASWFAAEAPTPSAAAIAAEAKADPLCLSAKALELFASIYGARAGNVALAFMATGGVYLGGGIAPKVADALEAGGFMRAFTAKGRFSALLSRIPVYVILDDQAALLGAAELAAEQPAAYPLPKVVAS